ncbi:MAG: DNA recombination protein RmuC [Candidatus Desantisbacteria bacterium]
MQLSIIYFILLSVSFVTGGFVAWLILKGKLALADANGRVAGEIDRTRLATALQEIESYKTRLADMDGRAWKLQADMDIANRDCAQLTERAMRLTEIEQANQNLLTERDNLLKAQANFQITIAELKITLDKEQTQSQEKLILLNEAREQLSNQFKILANEILDEKSKKFTDQNQTNLGQLLNPLKQQLTDFKTKIEEVYVSEGKDRSVLTDQVKQLIQLNNSLSQDAQNLTLALKGDRKAQGNWGEIILDDVLEKAGLVAGQHYERQGSIKSEDGQSHVIPDVVIHLPGDRHLVIDSKMTLPDYRAFASAEAEEERNAALKRHLSSIRTHIKGLSEKNYQLLYGLNSLDFVVMFIPLEPAFMLAVTNDCELFQQSWDKNVLLVSPSTLLFVVRTVAYLWRQEDLSRNAKDISSRGGELYDKLVGFVEDMQKVGERIQQAQNSYNDARKKFNEGSGNVIRQAEMLKSLGVKPSKTLPAQWVGLAMEEPS